MGVRIAEYLGVRVEADGPKIKPIKGKPQCPFMDAPCSKLKNNKREKPICSVRTSEGELWIVCKDRLCATKKNIPLSEYQRNILFSIAKCIFGSDIKPEDVYIKREIGMPVVEGSNYHADYVMMLNPNKPHATGQTRVVLEMQGGGETSATGEITRHVETWEQDPGRTNAMLSQNIKKTGTIVTNAWRRQQEQFLIKGNIARQTGGGIVFCVGSMIYDYLIKRLATTNLQELKAHNWDLALIGISENTNAGNKAGPIPLVIDEERIKFTDFHSFTQALINQGSPAPQIFKGKFVTLTGVPIEIPE
jgi:hypothetical protein